MEITKYDVHVHEILKTGQLSKQIVSRYFYVADTTEQTIRRAVFQSDLEIYKPYINNPEYIIHIVTDQKLCECEIDFFMQSIINDPDPCNFFMTRKK